jgi:chromosome segregation ATPase
MAKSEPQLDALRERLSGLLADWETEVSTVIRALEDQQSLAATQVEKVQELENQVNELAKLRQRVRERDLVLDHVTKKSKEKDVRLAQLEKEHKHARARIEELERQVGAPERPALHQKGDQQHELEAMRAELAARKSLVKSLRIDAERGKTLENELAEHREVIATLKETIAELSRRLASRDSEETGEVDGSHTVVIDMTEPLREARDERLRKHKRG